MHNVPEGGNMQHAKPPLALVVSNGVEKGLKIGFPTLDPPEPTLDPTFRPPCANFRPQL